MADDANSAQSPADGDAEFVHLFKAANDALTDDMVTRMAQAAADGLDLVDQANRAGLNRAIPALAAVVDNGLMLTERKTGRKRIFNEFDGLLSVYINALVPDGDYLWIGSDQGLTRFMWVNPDRVD